MTRTRVYPFHRATIVQHQRLPPSRGLRPKEALVNGATEPAISHDMEDSIQMSSVNRINGWSQQHIIGDGVSTVVDGQSIGTSGVQPLRQMSPDNFMIGGVRLVMDFGIFVAVPFLLI